MPLPVRPERYTDVHQPAPGVTARGRTLLLDIEADGILFAQTKGKRIDAATQFWCLAVEDDETGEQFYWGVDQGPQAIADGLRWIKEAGTLIAHNGHGFDFPVIGKLYPEYALTTPRLIDSLVVCKFLWPVETLVGPDLARIRSGRMPGQFLKRHSLAAWGYRTGEYKGDYSGGFHEWSWDMADYLMGDIRATKALWTLIKKKLKDPIVWPDRVVDEENEVARIILEQQWGGVTFDRARAVALAAELKNTQAGIEAKLKEAFGAWWQYSDPKEPAIDRDVKLAGYPDVTIRRFSEKTGKELAPYVGPPKCEYRVGQPYTEIEWVEYNPSSRDHLGQRLQEVYGWKPKKYGKDGKPAVDETVLQEIPESILPPRSSVEGEFTLRDHILDYFVVTKTLGMLSQGKKAWLALADELTGKMHGRMDPSGAITRRGIHMDPNLSQVPGVKKQKIIVDGVKKEVPLKGLRGRYGWECKELFRADLPEMHRGEPWEFTDCDASALELIDLGHYLYRLDGGAFSERVCDPSRDPHQEHADLAGLLRDDAKTAIYLKVYGGSAFKLSLDLDIANDEIIPNLAYRGLPMLLKSLERRTDIGPEFVAKMDDRQKAKLAKARQIIIKLENGIPGLKDLIKDVQGAAERGYLKAIDGSRVVVRKPHAALNTLLQSAGAITCKRWMVLTHKELKRLGLRTWNPFGPVDQEYDFRQVLWVHDALSFTHRPGLGPTILKVAEDAMVEAGVSLGLKGRYRTAGRTASNWAEAH